MKKRFPCGHRGFGKYCHACEDQKKEKTRTLAHDIQEAFSGEENQRRKKKRKK